MCNGFQSIITDKFSLGETTLTNLNNEGWSHAWSCTCVSTWPHKLTVLIENVEQFSLLFSQFLWSDYIHLVQHHYQWFVSKERFNTIKQFNLFLKRVPTLLRNIHNVKNGSTQMSKGCDSLVKDKKVNWIKRIKKFPFFLSFFLFLSLFPFHIQYK